MVNSRRPIAERDYPPGCRPAPQLQVPVHVPANGRRTRSPTVNGEPQPGRQARTPALPHSEAPPTIDVVWNFVPDPRDSPEELYAKRRKRFAALLRYYQQLFERGEIVGNNRPDVLASSKMKEDKQTCEWRGVGPVEGSVVGDFFYYRTELCVLGLHPPFQSGISHTSILGEPVGCSIVASGGYEDDVDNGETLIYTGQGGNNNAERRQTRDQVLERGNLALSNSFSKGHAVRVIRGHSNIPAHQSPSKKIYSYDGLYDVLKQEFAVGASGFRVYQFTLQRQPGQPELGSRLVSFVGKLNRGTEARTGVVVADISDGQEPMPVAVVNTIDSTRPPSSFEYTTKLRYPRGFSLPTSPSSVCSCMDCGADHRCACARRNSGRMVPYNQFGQLVRALPAVYECGRRCACGPDCHNRVCQKGLRYRLEIFKTESKGWGVRSWDFIPSGGFVCEYTGEVMDTNTANEMEDDEYLFNLDFKQGNEARWGDKVSTLFGKGVEERTNTTSCSSSTVVVKEQPKYCIDASRYGGVARFINHSCKPNLFVQCVLYDDCDLDLPHVMLFAASAIRPFQELTYDYGYTFNSVLDDNGIPKHKACHCDARNCREWMY